jgi:peptidoglycan/xylan/chitin deacetylase (PgdA/CDA1 family)
MPGAYQFSRTYSQLYKDLRTKTFDWITIDDGHESMTNACQLMANRNIRAKLFITTKLIGRQGYCTWEQLQELAVFHDIENHCHLHERLTWCKSDADIQANILAAQDSIADKIGRAPRYLAPPYNNTNKRVEDIAASLGLITVKNRIDILNTTP